MDLLRLESEEAGDQLQVVFDAVMYLFEHGLFFPEGGGEAVPAPLVRGDVPHDGGEEHARAAPPSGDGDSLTGKVCPFFRKPISSQVPPAASTRKARGKPAGTRVGAGGSRTIRLMERPMTSPSSNPKMVLAPRFQPEMTPAVS